jgi:UDP-glucose 4-epimerase
MSKIKLDYSELRILVTGGAGFIGSHTVDALMARGASTSVLDNFSTGRAENLEHWMKNRHFKLIRGDLLNPTDIGKAMKNSEAVFHLAANPEVRVGSTSPDVHFKQNVVATHNLLEAVRKNDVEIVGFTSTSTVYGEASEIPTPEDYSPLLPISVYGASKLACEALLISYSHTYGLKVIIYRLANIVGPRSRHGVIWDFVHKLRKNPRRLEILGDGAQIKSYLHVGDCIEAMLLGLEKAQDKVAIYNVGSEDQLDVKSIARIVIEEMGLKNVKFRFKGGIEGGGGWIGDVKNMFLDVGKLKQLGWKPKYRSAEAVRLTAKSILSGF